MAGRRGATTSLHSALLAACLALVSCIPGEGPIEALASLEIRADIPGLALHDSVSTRGSARGSLPSELDLSTLAYSVVLTNPSRPSVLAGPNPTGQFSLSSLPAGTWTLTATAQASLVTIGSATTTLTLAPGTSSSIGLDLIPPAGTGTLSLSWSWAFAAKARATLCPLVPAGAATELAIAAPGSSADYAGSLGAGLYRLALELENEDGTQTYWAVNTIVCVLGGRATQVSYAVAESAYVGTSAPSAPRLGLAFRYSGGSYGCLVSWFEAAGAQGISVERRSAASLAELPLAPYSTLAAGLAATAYGYADSGLVNGAFYQYRVTASNPWGSSITESAGTQVAFSTPSLSLTGFLAFDNDLQLTLSYASARYTVVATRNGLTLTPDGNRWHWYIDGSWAETSSASSYLEVNSSALKNPGCHTVTAVGVFGGLAYSSPPYVAVTTGGAGGNINFYQGFYFWAKYEGVDVIRDMQGTGYSPALSMDGKTIYTQAKFSSQSNPLNVTGFLFALNRANSNSKWWFETGLAPSDDSRNISPTIGPDGAIYAGGDNSCFRLRDDGSSVSLVWESPPLDQSVTATAALADGVLYVRTASSTYSIDAATGAIIGRISHGGFMAPIVIQDGSVLLDDFGAGYYYIYPRAFDSSSNPIWSFASGAAGSAGSHAAALCSTGDLILALSNSIICIAPGQSQPKWERSGIAKARPVVGAGDIVYAGSYDTNKLRAIDSGGNLLWNKSGTSLWPALCQDGSIYFVRSNLLYCFDSSGAQIAISDSFYSKVSSPCIDQAGLISIGANGSPYYGLGTWAGTGSPGANTAPWPMVDGNPQHTNDGSR